MRFALINGERAEPKPGLKGVCPICQAVTIARCGEVKVWHWAHKGILSCDLWWEKETEWHRSWKNNFSKEWQEVSHVNDLTGERHIADVKTDDGMIIEFQHSSITPVELRAREQFYKCMIWVVDGARLVSDFPRLLRGKKRFRWVDPSLLLVGSYEKYLPKAWMSSTVPVVFDFRSVAVVDEEETSHKSLWCLLPHRAWGMAVLCVITPTDFITLSKSGALIERLNQAVVKADSFDVFEQDLERERAYIEEKYRYRKTRYVRF